MSVEAPRQRQGGNPPTRRVRKIIATLSGLVFIWLGFVIPLAVFFFSAAWLQEGLPLLGVLWQVQPALRSPLTGVFIALGVGMVGGALLGASFWVRFLRREGLTRREDLWPFGEGKRRGAGTLPSEPQTAELVRSGRLVIMGFLGLGLWALLGAAVATFSIIPLGLWIAGETSLLHSVWQRSSLPLGGGFYWTGVISIFSGFLTGTPVAGFQWLRFVKNTLRLTDEEIEAVWSGTARRKK